MTGIYKITSPSKRVYIGQTRDYEKRLKTYRKVDCKLQVKLYNSLKKYGYKNHKFEFIHECEESELNNLERYYQDLYNCTCKNTGLNCVLVDSTLEKREYSEETRRRMSIAQTGKKMSKESIEKMRKTLTGRVFSASHALNTSIGKKKANMKHTKESKLLIGANNSQNILVLNIETGIFYDSRSAASRSIGMSDTALSRRFSGKFKNRTSLRQV